MYEYTMGSIQRKIHAVELRLFHKDLLSTSYGIDNYVDGHGRLHTHRNVAALP